MHHLKRVLFCVFFLYSVFGVGFSYAQCGGGTPVGEVTPIWRTQNGDGVLIPDLDKVLFFGEDTYALINVVQGIQYEIYKTDDKNKDVDKIRLCNGNQEISLSANYGSGNESKRSFTASISGQVRVYRTSWGVSTGLKIKIIGGQNTTDTKDVAPNQNNRWRIHFYGEQTDIAPESGIDAKFQNYLGYRDENESFRFFSSHVANSITPIGVFSNNAERLKVLNYFSAKAFMKTTRKGLYYVTLGADDGTRLFLDNQPVPVYDNWRTSHSTGYAPVENQVVKLTGSNTLHYEYFNKGVPLEYLFQIDDANKIIENTIVGEQTICQGGQASPITGDDFKRRAQHNFNPTFQFQWHYATNPNGRRTAIAGATQKDFTPDTKTTPFNQAGTYYLFREASVRFKNIGVAEKTEIIFSNAVKVTVLPQPIVSIAPPEKLFCQGENAQIRIKINNGGAPPFTFSYEVNNVPLPPIQSSDNIFYIPVNTSEAGRFNYKYVSVTDGNGCRVTLGDSDDITINPLPTATFLEQNTTLCLNTSKAQVPWVTFTGKPPFTVKVKATKPGGAFEEKEYSLENNQNRLVIEHIPDDKGEFTYEILWVRDANGCTTHFTNKKKVVNVVAPSITAPENVVWCLPEIVSAIYDNDGNTIITENGYQLSFGDTALDVVVNSVSCCSNPTLKWKVDDGAGAVLNGERQPSAYVDGIFFENDTDTDKTYTITYWLECNGQKYNYVTRQIRITPRPQIHFSN
ncbi:hypothetical protein [Capnocytophaga canimorsus]|uniref:hypothetical protein n=1 Tax=Capnocytophaga canimorsus TaxID=28188 RepID=UPI000D6EAB31|nr:hypothetical protein [Capnocytophaga canimorsus]AWL79232.1 hypothetical protein DKB58_09920 [Capnocytophaga canimorsus]MDT9498625.1 hypothetical protein [Capnocytophaga canimorsus]